MVSILLIVINYMYHIISLISSNTYEYCRLENLNKKTATLKTVPFHQHRKACKMNGKLNTEVPCQFRILSTTHLIKYSR